jgi:hypothetical protein
MLVTGNKNNPSLSAFSNLFNFLQAFNNSVSSNTAGFKEVHSTVLYIKLPVALFCNLLRSLVADLSVYRLK